MRSFFLLAFCFFFVGHVCGQEPRKPLSADEIKLKEELKRDNEFSEIDCRGRRPAENPAEADTKIRLKAFESFKKADKKSKLKKICRTIEGDPVYSYLMIEDGKASVVIDTTEDAFGSKRVSSHQCGELAVGLYFYDEAKQKLIFKEIEIGKIKDQQIILRCSVGDRELIF